jgi:anti-sigma regulatory factor (Ser/Thr protein kinase)
MDDLMTPRDFRASTDCIGPIAVGDMSSVGDARRAAQLSARTIGLSEEDAGRVGIVVTEMATNQVKHARGGTIVIQPLVDMARRAVLLIGVDRGEGMDVQAAMRDGHSSTGTAGNGLGAIRRMSDALDIHSAPGHGTAVVARIGGGGGLPSMPGLGLSLPYPGEQVCGDAWVVSVSKESRTVLVVDGLGHGPSAGEAARVAVDGFIQHAAAPIETILRMLHGLLRATRGAAAAVARADLRDGSLRYGGVGNISATLFEGAGQRSLISHNGTLGHQAAKFQEYLYPWRAGSLLILQSDGLSSRWKLDDLPGLRQRDPAVIAAVLVREYSRGRDDATAFVLKNEEAAP